jgi:hypothetical protein
MASTDSLQVNFFFRATLNEAASFNPHSSDHGGKTHGERAIEGMQTARAHKITPQGTG